MWSLYIPLLFLLAFRGVTSRHLPPRQAGHPPSGHPLGYYMGFSASGSELNIFPKMGAMNNLMVGPTDDDGNRQPRRNCIFYVNQRPPMNANDADWAKNRALQFAQLMNRAVADGDYHTLYDVYDLEEAFNAAVAGPMLDALEAGLLRPWFRATSAAYARLCAGRVFLVTDEENIWENSIWLTDEVNELFRSGLITQIVEIRPADIGRAYDNGGSLYEIPHHPYRGGQPPGANPPRGTDGSEVPGDIRVHPSEDKTRQALFAVGNPDVGADYGAPPINPPPPPPESICPGFNWGIIFLGVDVATGQAGYSIVDANCKQVAGTITKDACTESLFSCSSSPNKITELHLFGLDYACRGDPRAGRCPKVNTDVMLCCRNDGR